MSDSNAATGSRGDDHVKRVTPAGFLRQVVAELRKVVWPTQKQLGTYFVVVMVFVMVLMALVSVLDIAFGKFIFWLFT